MQDLSISEKNQSSYREAYLDNAATTKMSKAAIEAMLPCLDENYGKRVFCSCAGQEGKARVGR